jgi:hypothetical protein
MELVKNNKSYNVDAKVETNERLFRLAENICNRIEGGVTTYHFGNVVFLNNKA